MSQIPPPSRPARRLGAACFFTMLIACVALVAFPGAARAQTFYLLTSDGKLATTTAADFTTNSTPMDLVGVDAGDTLVAIDVRPQNQELYALGVNSGASTATLYHISTQTGVAAPVGPVGSIAFVDSVGLPVAFPDPATSDYDMDFNPAADRLRVVASSGLNFRVDPNTGAPIDGNGDGATLGVNPDGAIKIGTTTVTGAAYTNNQPNNGGTTTLYALDPSTDMLFIQNPPNGGNETSGVAITSQGGSLDLTRVQGFDIAPGINTMTTNSPVAAGSGYFVGTVNGVASFYSIDLTTASATMLGNPALDIRSIAIRTELGAAIALTGDGTSLVRFDPAASGTTTTAAITSIAGGETLVGIAERPQTGQLFGFAVNATNDTGTLYLIDPQNGVATPVGTSGQIAFVDGTGGTVDLPDPATTGYGVGFNPSADRVRVVTSTGLNFRIRPDTGAPVDGDLGGAAGSVNGTNADGPLTHGVAGAAYTNGFGQPIGTNLPTTLYVFDSSTSTLYIQNPPNAGTLTNSIQLSGIGTSATCGFAIPYAVSVDTAGAAATGFGYILGGTAGSEKLNRIDLATGAVRTSTSYTGGAAAGLVVFAVAPQIAIEEPVGTALANNGTADFGTDAGTQIPLDFTVINLGTVPLDFTATLDGNSVFQITAGNPGTATGISNATFTITYSPYQTGAETDVLRVASNDATTPSFVLNLTGPGLRVLRDDKVTFIAGETILSPLANDNFFGDVQIIDVSDSNITIGRDGRTLFLPAGYTGTSFTYIASDGTTVGQGTVTVITVAPNPTPVSFSGVVTDLGDFIVGFANATLSAKKILTVQLRGGPFAASAKISLPTVNEGAGVFTKAGFLYCTRNPDNTVDFDLSALGGDVFGTLRATATSATPAVYNMGLQSIDLDTPGGGYTIATVKATGAITLVGLLPDGTTYSSGTKMGDNGSISFFATAKGPKTPSVVGGQLLVEDLTDTDITGELNWTKYPQPLNAKGLYLDGVDTVLLANGSIYKGALPAGTMGTLSLSDGDLLNSETNTVNVTNGIPAVAGSLKKWTAVTKTGIFTVSVQVPGKMKPVKGTGVYLPKSKSALGFFPGIVSGGLVGLKIP